MPSSLVDNHMLNLLEPIKADIGEIRKRHIAGDTVLSRLTKEVNALRVTGQATQDNVAVFSAKRDALTKSMGVVAVAQASSSGQAAGSSQQPQPARYQHTEHHSIGTPCVSSLARGKFDRREPESVRKKLVALPYKHPAAADDRGDEAGRGPQCACNRRQVRHNCCDLCRGHAVLHHHAREPIHE